MSLKTLREIAAESNAFDAALKSATAAGDVQAWDSRGLIAWLGDCVAHGRYLPSGSPEREALQALVDYWTSRLLQLDHTGSDDLDRLADFDPTAGVPLIADCPYPGLEPYAQGQRVSFFGREQLIRECVAHLEDPAKRIFLIIGASGSGKSSLALAGVFPELEKRHGAEWLIAPRFTPNASVVLFGGQAKAGPYPGSTMVSTFNAGLSGLVRSLALELAPLRVNAVHPGVVGDSTKWQHMPDHPVVGRTPLGRLVLRLSAGTELLAWKHDPRSIGCLLVGVAGRRCRSE